MYKKKAKDRQKGELDLSSKAATLHSIRQTDLHVFDDID